MSVDQFHPECETRVAACLLLVLERTGLWAAGLRAALGRGEMHPVEIRHQDAAEESLRESPASVLIVEITAENLADRLTWIAGLRQLAPQAIPIAAAERRLAPWQSLIREAGAEAWVESPTRLAGVARMVRRQMLRYPPPLPDLRTAWRERLPW